MIIKLLHEVMHALTPFIIHFLKCCNLPRNKRTKRRRLSLINTPIKVGTNYHYGKKNAMSGDCGNAFEEILSGGFRFSYVSQRRCPIIDSIVALNPRGTAGFYVPQRCIEKSLNELTQFGQVIRAELLTAPPIPDAVLSGSELIKCAHGTRLRPLLPPPGMKY